jgi:hypothetical protein
MRRRLGARWRRLSVPAGQVAGYDAGRLLCAAGANRGGAAGLKVPHSDRCRMARGVGARGADTSWFTRMSVGKRAFSSGLPVENARLRGDLYASTPVGKSGQLVGHTHCGQICTAVRQTCDLPANTPVAASAQFVSRTPYRGIFGDSARDRFPPGTVTSPRLVSHHTRPPACAGRCCGFGRNLVGARRQIEFGLRWNYLLCTG